jgi:3'-phosphoadenosine 5'-phosphosulfate (PAPS) 3'-phosphatase
MFPLTLLSALENTVGMCKHCLVGVGATEATLRLPPTGYREKIWDHVAGTHFVTEAGGRVTDLTGRELDFGALMPGKNGAGELAIGEARQNCDATSTLHYRVLNLLL